MDMVHAVWCRTPNIMYAQSDTPIALLYHHRSTGLTMITMAVLVGVIDVRSVQNMQCAAQCHARRYQYSERSSSAVGTVYLKANRQGASSTVMRGPLSCHNALKVGGHSSEAEHTEGRGQVNDDNRVHATAYNH